MAANNHTVRHSTPLAVSIGEPAGIGPEIILKSWLAKETEAFHPFYVIGDPDFFDGLSKKMSLAVPIVECEPADAMEVFGQALPVHPLQDQIQSTPGKLNEKNGPLVTSSIMTAVDHVFAGKASGLVTAPINKKALYESGFEYPGHTEFLAALAENHTGKSITPVMMIAGPELKTIPVTIHIPLIEVPSALTTEQVYKISKIAAMDLEMKFGIASPRLAISGLNPHAGESGAMGKEDEEIIRPAVEALRSEGINAFGPLPADTMFHKSARATYDVAICMYHDQALIPAKTLGFDDAVNVTLGLPFIRTSPDHGTALDIADKGIANPSSMIAAIKMASDMIGFTTHSKSSS